MAITTIRDQTPAELKKEYLALISRPKVSEEKVHQFLVDFPMFLPLWYPYENTVFSKLPLGNQHTTDFAHVREDSPGAKWHFIEIEKPCDRLFTKAGNPSAKLTHAMRQLHDWESWYLENRDYVGRHFPFSELRLANIHANPELRLVIGRRAEIGNNERKLMQRLSDRPIMIMTFDRLADQISWPSCEHEKSLKTCSFVNGRIKRIAEMQMNITFSVSSRRV